MKFRISWRRVPGTVTKHLLWKEDQKSTENSVASLATSPTGRSVSFFLAAARLLTLVSQLFEELQSYFNPGDSPLTPTDCDPPSDPIST